MSRRGALGIAALVALAGCAPRGAEPLPVASTRAQAAESSSSAHAISSASPADSAPEPTLSRPKASDAPALAVSGTSPDSLVLIPDEERKQELDALALFPDERLRCEGVERTGRCETVATSRLQIGELTFVTVLTASSWEHDGMYGAHETVALVTMQPAPAVIHTLQQWQTSVYDCGSSIDMRRYAVVSESGTPLLCVEAVSETGIGLFDVMDLEKNHKPYRPLARERRIEAFRYRSATRAFEREPDKDASCPKKGYAMFVPGKDREDDVLSPRRSVQGNAPTIACPPKLFGGCMVPMCEGKSKPKN